ncbi:precorrin-3B synthase [Nonomuraea sp. NPDC050536]|uniref:precorrin-3B synthase n=1 Tax=Nonomuraea sp. NPDC050536 TaxID=3364366 RepID=UPI0037C9884D
MSIADFSGRLGPDACPGALQVHQAADGPMARVRVPGGAISAGQLLELATCADELGSGVIELTSRANVQVRGLRSPEVFASRMAAAGLLPSASHERVRNIVASPLGGRGPSGALDPQPLVESLDRALCATPRLAGLPGRFLFAVDDGTNDVTSLTADVTYASGQLLLAGMTCGTAAIAGAVAVMIAAAEAFLDVRGDAWRIAEVPGGAATVAARMGLTVWPPDLRAGPENTQASPPRAGGIAQRDGRAALEVVAPLGRLSPDQARALGAADVAVRLTPWRTVMLLDLDDVGQVTQALEAAGLVTDSGSPWVGVTACTGRPGCAKALADVQADARAWVGTQQRAQETRLHWSGCERRCGLPRGTVTQRVATENGYR